MNCYRESKSSFNRPSRKRKVGWWEWLGKITFLFGECFTSEDGVKRKND
jgi:hypothetical protein